MTTTCQLSPKPSKALVPLTQRGSTSSYEDYRLNLGPWTLEHGKHLSNISIACRLYGRNNGPLYIVLGGISSNRILCHDSSGQQGWWNDFVGPGCALDTQRCRVLGIDFLGTGDSTRPRHLTDWALTPADQANVLYTAWRQLSLTAKLPTQISGLIGASYGGMVTLHWAQRYPNSIKRALLLCAAHRSNPTTSAYRSLQRRIVRFADEQGQACEGLRLARGLAMLGFRSTQEIDTRFDGAPTFQAQQVVLPIDDYLAARGKDYAKQHSPASFHCLSQSCDLHQIKPASINSELWLAATPSDLIVPFEDVKTLADQAPNVRYFQRIESIYGHDCFLKQSNEIQQVLRRFQSCDINHSDAVQQHINCQVQEAIA